MAVWRRRPAFPFPSLMTKSRADCGMKQHTSWQFRQKKPLNQRRYRTFPFKKMTGFDSLRWYDPDQVQAVDASGSILSVGPSITDSREPQDELFVLIFSLSNFPGR